jgi:CBS domain-containing protein
MTTVRDIMTADVECVGTSDTLDAVARVLADADVGSVPVCDDEGEPVGIVTDRDIVVECVARGEDPRTTEAGSFRRQIVGVSADDDIGEALESMQEHQVRRLLVYDDGAFVGILSQADVALAAAPEDAGRTVAAVSTT